MISHRYLGRGCTTDQRERQLGRAEAVIGGRQARGSKPDFRPWELPAGSFVGSDEAPRIRFLDQIGAVTEDSRLGDVCF